ncbi:MAG: hypothetical protein ACK5OX_13735 [Desertimonas sp.]
MMGLTLSFLRRVERGVYALTTAHSTLEHRCRRLCALHPGGFVTGPTAAMLGGLRRQPFASLLHFSIRHGVHHHWVGGVRFRQTTQLCPLDRRVRPDGIVVASWPRLAFDLAADLAPLDHRSVLHQLRERGLVTVPQLVEIGDRLVHPARRGSKVYELSLMELGERTHDSHPELLLADALLRRGVPVEPQLEVAVDGGVVVHLDLGVRVARWGIEADVHPEHRSVEGHGRDAGRYRWLHGQEWQIEPVAERDLANVEQLADELAVLYRRRAANVRVPSGPHGYVRHSVGAAGERRWGP